MEFITLNDIKDQCRIDIADDSEDELLKIYGDAAEKTVENMIHRDKDEIIDKYTELPAPLKTAMLILTAQYYKYREATTPDAANNVPWGVQCLIQPYVRLTSRDND